MILPLIFLLASLLQRYGSEAESSHVSKFHPPSVKEQNALFERGVLYLASKACHRLPAVCHFRRRGHRLPRFLKQPRDFSRDVGRRFKLYWRRNVLHRHQDEMTKKSKSNLASLAEGLSECYQLFLHNDSSSSSLTSWQQAKQLHMKQRVQDSHQEKIITVSGEGMVQSPDFPNTYPRNTALVWRLVATNNMRIQLNFDERFGLEDPEDGICKYDFVEIEDPTENTILGRWCGSQSAPASHTSKGSQIRIRFISDEYFPSEPGFCIRYSLLPPTVSEPEVPAVLPPSQQGIEELSDAVAGLGTVEEVMKFLEPERWQLDMEELYKPTWHVLGKSFILNKKARGGADLNLLREEVRLYSCTPRNFSVSLREELKRTDAIFWPSCLLVKRCGGNCACCSHRCYDCQCVPARVTKKYHEVLLLKHRSGVRGLQKSMTDVALEHHEECACVCKDDWD